MQTLGLSALADIAKNETGRQTLAVLMQVFAAGSVLTSSELEHHNKVQSGLLRVTKPPVSSAVQRLTDYTQLDAVLEHIGKAML